ncbi:MAG: hypothetical protein M1827_004375 [Pycnora praestabilis]|nr:MAG: hypothetical protein M1827_004375 [Pycnora praestabilis]
MPFPQDDLPGSHGHIRDHSTVSEMNVSLSPGMENLYDVTQDEVQLWDCNNEPSFYIQPGSGQDRANSTNLSNALSLASDVTDRKYLDGFLPSQLPPSPVPVSTSSETSDVTDTSISLSDIGQQPSAQNGAESGMFATLGPYGLPVTGSGADTKHMAFALGTWPRGLYAAFPGQSSVNAPQPDFEVPYHFRSGIHTEDDESFDLWSFAGCHSAEPSNGAKELTACYPVHQPVSSQEVSKAESTVSSTTARASVMSSDHQSRFVEAQIESRRSSVTQADPGPFGMPTIISRENIGQSEVANDEAIQSTPLCISTKSSRLSRNVRPSSRLPQNIAPRLCGEDIDNESYLLSPDLDSTQGSFDNEFEVGPGREHPLYQAMLSDDGMYHCPFEGQEGCAHKSTKLKCNYDKHVDSHLRPYRCRITTCIESRFSSTACLLRHEREAHGMHGHGAKPHLCTYEDCDRSVPGNGFPRRWNLYDHMKRVHDYTGAPSSNGSTSPTPSSTSVQATSPKGQGHRKRKPSKDSGIPSSKKNRSLTSSEIRKASSLPSPVHDERAPHLQDLENKWSYRLSRLRQNLDGVLDPRDLQGCEEVEKQMRALLNLSEDIRRARGPSVSVGLG